MVCEHSEKCHHHNHSHEVNESNAKKTFVVIVVTVLTMALEIGYGYFTNSMALLSDGLHMGTHAFALTITFAAYVLMKKFAESEYFPNGTQKISTLAGYTSSLFLGITGILVIVESVERFFNPLQIVFNTAILVAVIGLVVNGICLLIMSSKQEHSDYNFKAAYLHILTDALTSIFAIAALILGKFWGLYFLDPLMGILGGILILRWSFGLIKDTACILVDMETHKHTTCDNVHSH